MERDQPDDPGIGREVERVSSLGQSYEIRCVGRSGD
jgi:hypothetical protein